MSIEQAIMTGSAILGSAGVIVTGIIKLAPQKKNGHVEKEICELNTQHTKEHFEAIENKIDKVQEDQNKTGKDVAWIRARLENGITFATK